MKESNSYIIYTDGGARGNPGPAAIGFVIKTSTGQLVKSHGEYIGETTNNEAEYRGAIAALKKLKALIGKQKAKQAEVRLNADSELMVSHMRGLYKVEHQGMQKLFLELWNLCIDFKKVSFAAVPREKNKEADAMVNQALDDAVGKRPSLF